MSIWLFQTYFYNLKVPVATAADGSYFLLFGENGTLASMRENLTLHANNKGADQPAHERSLISTFVIPYLESIVVDLASCKISIF